MTKIKLSCLRGPVNGVQKEKKDPGLPERVLMFLVLNSLQFTPLALEMIHCLYPDDLGLQLVPYVQKSDRIVRRVPFVGRASGIKEMNASHLSPERRV
jgi:hypothetical protein